jgi:hypothetical protein
MKVRPVMAVLNVLDGSFGKAGDDRHVFLSHKTRAADLSDPPPYFSARNHC